MVAASNKPHLILVVDDNLADQRFLATILKDGGYVVHVASSGATALEMADALKPDLLLLDLHMPGLDGFQLCERFKRSPSTRDVPVVFVSGADEALDKATAFSVGAVDYIQKPFAEEEVLARVKTHLSLRDLQQKLEDVVRLRTEELTQVIERLNSEIEARKSAEQELKRQRKPPAGGG